MNTHERPVVIGFVRVDLLPVHLQHVLVCKGLSHLLQDRLFNALFRHHDSHEELGWDPEPQHAINVGADYFQVHQRLEKELIVRHCSLAQRGGSVIQLLKKDVALCVFSFPRGFVVNELARSVTFSAKRLNNVFSLFFVDNKAVNSISFLVFHSEGERW